jgi:phosphatidylglycerophosphate synthase
MTCALSFPAAHEPEETPTGRLLDALTDIVNVAGILAGIAEGKTGIPGHFLARLLVCFVEEACDAVEVLESDRPA